MTQALRDKLAFLPAQTPSNAGDLVPVTQIAPRKPIPAGPFRGLDTLDVQRAGLAYKRWVGMEPVTATEKGNCRTVRNIAVAVVKRLLAIWYDVKVEKKTSGLDGPIKGALLLVTPHTGLDDPPLVYANIWRLLPAMPVATEGVFAEFGSKRAMSILNGLPVPDARDLGGAGDEVDLLAVQIASALRQAESSPKGYLNVGVHVAGEILRDNKDRIDANSLVAKVLALKPDTKLIAVVPRGLNGSPMSRAGQSQFPSPADAVSAYGRDLIYNLRHFPLRTIFKGAVKERRKVTIELHDVTEQMRNAGSVRAQNLILEELGNKPDPITGTPNPAWYVPRRYDDPRPYEAFATPERPRYELRAIDESKAAHIKDACLDRLTELANTSVKLERETALADLGLDSLTICDHVLPWVNSLFGRNFTTAEAFVTVGDVIDAATGALPCIAGRELKSASAAFAEQVKHAESAQVPDVSNVVQSFFRTVRTTPQRIVLVDEHAGEVTAAQLASLVSLVLPDIEKVPGDRVGMLMQNGILASATQLAVMIAGKTPVMADATWTDAQLDSALKLAGATHVLTSQSMIRRLKSQKRKADTDALVAGKLSSIAKRMDKSRTPFPSVEERFVPVEQMLRDASDYRAVTGGMFFNKRLKLMERRASQISSDSAAAYFIKYDGAQVQLVPQSHSQLMGAIKDMTAKLALKTNDVILHTTPTSDESAHIAGMLAPATGIPVVTVEDPNHVAITAELSRNYGATVSPIGRL